MRAQGVGHSAAPPLLFGAQGVGNTVGVVVLFAAWTGLLALSKFWLARWAAAGGMASARWQGGYLGIGGAAMAALLARQALRTHTQARTESVTE